MSSCRLLITLPGRGCWLPHAALLCNTPALPLGDVFYGQASHLFEASPSGAAGVLLDQQWWC